ncbi:hypothetical protein ACTQ4Q_04760 [Bacillota bacterium LCP21S3_D9]|nr:hypothetical protein [Bacillota bacterium]
MTREEMMGQILQEILVQGEFYRKRCHKCMFWHPRKGCHHNWHGCYYVQEEIESWIEKAQKAAPKLTGKPSCEVCQFRNHASNCRLLCTRQILRMQGICFPDNELLKASEVMTVACV